MNTMNNTIHILAAGLVLLTGALLGEGLYAAAASQEAVDADTLFSYRPPLRGAPANRVGSGARGATAADGLVMCALAPDHAGRTVSAQPVLYWYVSRAERQQPQLTLYRNDTGETVLNTLLQAPRGEAVRPIALSDYGVRLESGVDYKWRIALPGERLSVGGEIRRVTPHARLLAGLKSSANDARAAVYAREGIWYDAIAALSGQIATEPLNQLLWQQRAALLMQEELPKAAAFDQRMAAP